MKIQSISFNVLKEMSKDFKMKKEWSNKKRQYERVVTIKPYWWMNQGLKKGLEN